MKICAMGYDANGRSYASHVDIPLKKVSDTYAVSEKQPAAYWGLSLNQNSPLDNEYEMHLTNVPRIVGVMSGHAEITMQNGDVCRLGPGEFIFVHGKALHHSTMRSTVPTATLNVTFAGTEGYEFK
jgi:hypothetical protein